MRAISKTGIFQQAVMPMNDLLTQCLTTLLEPFQGSVEVLFFESDGATDGLPSISAWDTKQSSFLLVDFGDQIDASYPTWRGWADEVMTRAAMPFLRIAAFRNRQEFADRLDWLPSDTVVWLASEPKHHIDLGGSYLISFRATR